MNNDENVISLSNLFESEESDFEQDFEMIDINDEEDEPPKEEKKEEIIDLNNFFDEPKQEEIKEEIVKVKKEKKNHDKLIERIQLGLIIFLVVAGTLTYFFGYQLFEPFIKID